MAHTRISLRIITILFWTFFVFGRTAHAQDAGRVAGRVLDQTGAVLPGVTIDLVVGSREMSAATDGSSEYRFEVVPPGRAEPNYRLLDFSLLRRNVVVGRGASATADAVLTLSLNADVIVTGTATFRNVADIENPAENLVGIASAARVKGRSPPRSSTPGR